MMREKGDKFQYESGDDKPSTEGKLIEGLWRWKDFYPIGCQEPLGCRVELFGFKNDGFDPEDSVYGYKTFVKHDGVDCAEYEKEYREYNYTWATYNKYYIGG